LGKESVSRRTK
jgi:hypothetical protein